MTKTEYALLTKDWEMDRGKFDAAGESCLEEGWMDHFGFVTPKGYKALDEYEEGMKIRFTPMSVLVSTLPVPEDDETDDEKGVAG